MAEGPPSLKLRTGNGVGGDAEALSARYGILNLLKSNQNNPEAKQACNGAGKF